MAWPAVRIGDCTVYTPTAFTPNGDYLGVASERGVYTYKIKALYLNGKVDERRGTVTLMH